MLIFFFFMQDLDSTTRTFSFSRRRRLFVTFISVSGLWERTRRVPIPFGRQLNNELLLFSNPYDNKAFSGTSLLAAAAAGKKKKKKKTFKFTMKKSINQTFKSARARRPGHNGGEEGADEGSAIM